MPEPRVEKVRVRSQSQGSELDYQESGMAGTGLLLDRTGTRQDAGQKLDWSYGEESRSKT